MNSHQALCFFFSALSRFVVWLFVLATIYGSAMPVSAAVDNLSGMDVVVVLAIITLLLALFCEILSTRQHFTLRGDDRAFLRETVARVAAGMGLVPTQLGEAGSIYRGQFPGILIPAPHLSVTFLQHGAIVVFTPYLLGDIEQQVVSALKPAGN